MVGLLLLKHIYGLSDEDVCECWVYDPYFQHFTGEEFFQHTFPHERSRAGCRAWQAFAEPAGAIARLGARTGGGSPASRNPGISFPVSPNPRSCFFQQTQFQRLLGATTSFKACAS